MKNYSILYQVILNYYRTRGKVREEEEKKKQQNVTWYTHLLQSLYTFECHTTFSLTFLPSSIQ
jgi:hypothetical protein